MSVELVSDSKATSEMKPITGTAGISSQVPGKPVTVSGASLATGGMVAR